MFKVPAVVLCLALLLIPVSATATQTPAIAEVSAIALEHDPAELANLLTEAPSDDLLPEGFSTASPLAENLQSEELEAYRSAGFDQLVAVRTFSIATSPANVEAPSPVADSGATPTAENRPGTQFYSSGTITYLIFDSALDVNAMDGFGATLSEVISRSGTPGELEKIEYQGTPALRVRSSNLVNGVELRSEWLVVPVGNVAIVTSYTSGADQLEDSTLDPTTEQLAESAIMWLTEKLQHEPVGIIPAGTATR